MTTKNKSQALKDSRRVKKALKRSLKKKENKNLIHKLEIKLSHLNHEVQNENC